MRGIKVTHFFHSFRSLGGVESLLHRHYEEDEHWGIDSTFVIYSEASDPSAPRIHGLGFRSSETIGQARKRFAEAAQAVLPDVAVYHNVWGMSYFSDLDRASRRILVQHGQIPGLDVSLDVRSKWLDGVLCVSDTLVPTMQKHLPHLEAERIEVIPYPIAPPSVDRQFKGRRGQNQVLTLGVSGRVSIDQKRVDRLPGLVGRLQALGLPFRLEILGEGSDSEWLQRQFSDQSNVRFLGKRTGHSYWATVRNWDVLLSTSDYEGLPLSFLEALAMGVIPIYPKIGSGADAYVKSLHPRLLYDVHEPSEAADAVRWVAELSEEEMVGLRHQCQDIVAPHVDGRYFAQFSKFVQRLRDLPKVSLPVVRPYPPFMDRLSFRAVGRFGRARQSLLRFKRRVGTLAPFSGHKRNADVS